MSTSPYDIVGLVEKIKISSNHLDKDNGEARRQCLDAARTLSFALETPVETLLRHCWAEVGRFLPEYIYENANMHID